MIEAGDRVLLKMGEAAFSLAPKGLQRWDDCQFIVDKVKSCGAYGTYYELKSCKSAEGVPYSIIEDWLVPMR